MKIISKYMIYILLMLMSAKLFGEDFVYNRFQYGLFGNYILIDEKANFRNLPTYPTCSPFFSSGTGHGFSAGLLAEYPISKMLFIGTRLGYESYSTEMSTDELFPYQRENSVATGKIKHELETKFNNVTGEISLGFRPFGGLILSGGFQFGLPFSPKFSQRELLVEPLDYGTFENGKRERNVYNNKDLPNVVKPIVLAKVLLSYEFPLNRTATFRLVPEVSYNYALTPVIGDYDWHDNSIRGGLALKFSRDEYKPLFAEIGGDKTVNITEFESCDTSFLRVEPAEITFIPAVYSAAGVKEWSFRLNRGDEIISEIRSEDKIPEKLILPLSPIELNQLSGEYTYSLEVTDKKEQTVFSENKIEFLNNFYGLNTSVEGYGIDIRNNGEVYKKTSIQLLRKISANVRPLLNYVFFEAEDAEIPSRYIRMNKKKASKFSEKNLNNDDALQVYHQLLNIIGSRMTQHAGTTIALNGCVSSLPEEISNLNLAKSRAESVKNYLTEVWNIEPDRIKINKNFRPTGLPEVPSLPGAENHIKESAEENRRVEIIPDSNSAFLLDPVVTGDTLNQVFPLNFIFKPAVRANGQKYSWQLNLAQNGKLFARYNGNDEVPDSIEVVFKDRESEMIDKGGNLVYEFIVQDEFGQECKNYGEINVEMMKVDSSINRYSLILFDFERYEIGSRNKQIVGMIDKAITNNASLTVSGYTDQLGDSDNNLILSKNRALATMREICGDSTLSPDDNLPMIDRENTVIIRDRNYKKMINKQVNNMKLTVYGVGEMAPLYDNSTPEGRFYCRTVTITIANETKNGE